MSANGELARYASREFSRPTLAFAVEDRLCVLRPMLAGESLSSKVAVARSLLRRHLNWNERLESDAISRGNRAEGSFASSGSASSSPRGGGMCAVANRCRCPPRYLFFGSLAGPMARLGRRRTQETLHYWNPARRCLSASALSGNSARIPCPRRLCRERSANIASHF